MSAPSKRRQIFSWCLFDFANSSFTTVIVTVVFAVYFKDVIAKDAGGATLWAVCGLVSNLAILVSAPVVGAMADRSSGKKRFLFLSYIVCVACTAGLFFTGPGVVIPAMILFVIANFAFATGENIVAGFLPDLAEPEEMGRVSSWGWAIGYAGGLLALFLCLPLALSKDDTAIRGTNLVVAGFFLLGGLPTFLWVREPRSRAAPARFAELARAGLAQVRHTLHARREHVQLFRFLLAYTVFNIGIYGVIAFAGIYAESLFDMELDEIITVFIVTQVAAGLGALASGPATRRFDCTRTVAMTLVVWTAAGVLGLLAGGRAAFWILAILAGLAMGSSLPTARAAIGRFAPEAQSAEIFGFWGLCARGAAILSHGGFLAVHAATGSLRATIAYFTASFVVGLVLLWRVDETKGLEEAGHR